MESQLSRFHFEKCNTGRRFKESVAFLFFRIRHLTDEDGGDVAYIDHDDHEGDLLEWLTLYDAPRQSKLDSDL